MKKMIVQIPQPTQFLRVENRYIVIIITIITWLKVRRFFPEWPSFFIWDSGLAVFFYVPAGFLKFKIRQLVTTQQFVILKSELPFNENPNKY